MEEGLGWEHGVQFVCLAFQNAMAAQINGHTVHHWSGIPARNDDGNATAEADAFADGYITLFKKYWDRR